MSQENVSDKVRNLQRQIASSIKFGQKPPSLRRSEGDEGSTDDEEVPRSPVKVPCQAQVQPVPAPGEEEEPPKPEPKYQAPPAGTPQSPPARSPRSRRVLPPTGTIESINLDAVPQSGPRLDNAAAKHKLAVKPKNQRVSRKHRRFTQDLHDVSIPGVLEEDPEADAPRRASASEPLQPFESVRRRQHEEDARKRREEDERRRAEEDVRRAEEQRKLVEERRRREEEEERLQREAEERRAREELLQRQREEEEARRAEEERKKREEEARRRREAEEEEARRQQELSEKRRREEEEERRRREEEETRKRKEEEERRKQQEERARKEKEEELRWREMEERQKPFSFKVSSGEKQILFQKVNLTPVAPGSSHPHEVAAKPASSEDSSSVSPSTYIPHTAILVTGAQLCGPAVNLDQIRDTACKSLLGLEERRAPGTPGTPSKHKTSPDRKSGKTKSLGEASFPADQPGSDVLAEWASIRSKIFRGVEDGSYPDPEMTKCQPSPEEQPEFSHTHLRKTMSASAKFSITPAKKKFGDSNRNSEVYSPEDVSETYYEPPVSPAPKPKSKSVRIAERASDECVFAKDLPSFLVPGAKPDSEMLKARTYSESYESKDLDEDLIQDGQDAPSPFGIKLRRTNYSLRFHNEQSTEKRKKRYSDGDNFDGVPSPLTPIEPDSDVSERLSPMSPQKDGAVSRYMQSPRAKPAKSPSPTPHAESEKVIPKPAVYRRPATSPKPSGSAPTPPPSPLPKVHHGMHGSREAAAESASREHVGGRGEETQRSALVHSQGHSQGHSPGEEEPKEKKSFFPSINIPWREKTDRKTELMRKEKPSLQSRHSLDSAKVQEKEGAPLWIHLALQKQKGFREQQQNRDDRRSQREAKLAEKQARDRDSLTLPSPTESRGSGSTSPSSKPQTPEEPRRPDSLLGRLERREQLKKANTLPSSVTVEIADSTPSPPAVKDVAKRFPSGDSGQVSTEPAWLALAKRKAKAWSDCPQIIK